MTNVLFICGKARMRSPTAADIVAAWPEVASDFAGLSRDADEHLSTEHLAWADLICVMEKRQQARLTARFSAQLRTKKVVVLGVPDRFDYMQPELVTLLTPKLKRLLRPLVTTRRSTGA